ncbi:hypothetical protein INT47_004242 [Mucor saturninus]|uniref:Uncharacterized protein n=1 Tax=Mucor saturninus TaxID=64648 RepID=A0A8H7RA27_9FUNG|nr:hypothetical protein INT47_004242 [Mucor saturninus]
MTSYWYSTNGMNQRRLSNRHLSILDQAFERHARIQLYDDEVFGLNIAAMANPYQGTMTAGDLHFGLYRQPPMWRMSDTSLDTLILMDSHSENDETMETKNRQSTGDLPDRMSDASLDDNLSRPNNNNNSNNNNNNRNSNQSRYKYLQKKKPSQYVDENCICCRIS